MFKSLIEKRKNKYADMQNDIEIEVDRDSVCMADDCESHKVMMNFPEHTRLSHLMKELIGYLPSMRDVVWAIRSDIGMCGYIITDKKMNISFELCGSDRLISEMKIRKILCKYYYPSCFSYLDGDTGKRIRKYSECPTLLEKVKKDNEQE